MLDPLGVPAAAHTGDPRQPHPDCVMYKSRHPRWVTTLALGLTACLIATACGSHQPPATNGPTPDRLVAALRGPYNSNSTNVVIEALARAGVAVQADESSSASITPISGPTAPLRLTRWEARNLALEVAQGGGGVLGSELDQLVGMPSGAPPFSYLVAAWITTSQSPGGKLANGLMGTQNWAQAPSIAYPMLVVVLFLADVITQMSAATRSGSATTAADRQTSPQTAELLSVVSTPCSAISGFVQGVLNGVASALQVSSSSSGVGGFFASIWNTAVNLARQAINVFLTTLTAPVIAVLRTGIGAVAVFTMVASYLRRWQAPIVATPTQTQFSWGSSPDITGSFTVTVNRNGEEEQWPSQLLDCAKAVGVDLPQLSGPGAPVTWTVVGTAPGLVFVSAPGPPFTGTLDSNLSAHIDYVTGRESQEAHDSGDPINDRVTVAVSIKRTDVDQLKALIEGFVINQVPSIVQPVVNPLLLPYLQQATQSLNFVADVTGVQTLAVLHHGPPHPTPSSAPTPTSIATSTTAPLADACGLLDTSDVDALLGGSPQEVPMPQQMPGGGNGCAFKPTSEDVKTPWVNVTVGVVPTAYGPALHQGKTAISGVGDEAYLYDRPDDTLAQVDVRSGSAWFLVQVNLVVGGAASIAETLARTAEGRL